MSTELDGYTLADARTVDDVLALIDRALHRIYPDGPRKGYVSPMP